MKKNFLLIITLLFCCVGIVNAEEKRPALTYDWSIKQGASANYLYYDATVEVEDGYITTTITETNTAVIRKISKDGSKIIWEVKEPYGLFYGLTTDGENIYSLFIDTTNNYRATYLMKYNLDGKQISYIYLEQNDTYDGEI